MGDVTGLRSVSIHGVAEGLTLFVNCLRSVHLKSAETCSTLREMVAHSRSLRLGCLKMLNLRNVSLNRH